jgi:5-methylcytosine-specific restriction protein A
MPARLPHFCAMPGCGALTLRRRCPVHELAAEQARPNIAVRRWYRTKEWRALRTRVLREQAYQCAACGQVAAGLDVDHIKRHEGLRARFWDRANLQALCRPCHSRKTQRGE